MPVTLRQCVRPYFAPTNTNKMKLKNKHGQGMLKKSAVVLLTVSAAFFTSCKKEDTKPVPEPPAIEDPAVITVNSNITANATWLSGKTYILGARIAVTSGVVLTIQPGVIVKGDAGTCPNATCLTIAR